MSSSRGPQALSGAFSAENDSRRRAGREDDLTDYDHRDFVNLLAAALLLFVAIGVVWSVKSMQEYEATRACLDSGRRDCLMLDVPHHYAVRAPSRR